MTEETYFSDSFKSSTFRTTVEIERFELRLTSRIQMYRGCGRRGFLAPPKYIWL